MSVLDYIKDIFNNPAKYRKFWVAIGGASLQALSVAFIDNPIVQVFIAGLTAGGVLQVPNHK